MKKNFKAIIFYIVLFVAIAFTVSTFISDKQEIEDPILSDVVDYFEKDAVINFEIDEKLNLTMKVPGEDASYGEDGKLDT